MKWFFFTSCLLLSLPASAQKDYVRGYVLQTNGDTLKGYILMKNWDRNPSKIKFRKRLKSEDRTFSVLDLKEFRTRYRAYVSAIVDYENSPFRTHHLEFGRELRLEKDTTFLEVLYQGSKGLYAFRSRNGKDNFYIKTDKGYELLKHKRFRYQRGTMVHQAESKKYRGQLQRYLAECTSIEMHIKGVLHSRKSISRLFERYYKCTKTRPTFRLKT